MKRLAIAIILCLSVAFIATPAHAVIVAQCGGRSVLSGDSCHTDFLAVDGGYFLKAHPGRLFTGRITVQVTNPVAGFSVTGSYVLGRLVTGSDTLLHDLTFGTWKLTVTAAPLSIGNYSGSVEAGPF
jgi:hypothetical protein